MVPFGGAVMKFRSLSFLTLAVSCLCLAASDQNVSEAYAALNGNWQLTGAWADMSRPHHKEDKNDEAHVSLEVAQGRLTSTGSFGGFAQVPPMEAKITITGSSILPSNTSRLCGRQKETTGLAVTFFSCFFSRELGTFTKMREFIVALEERWGKEGHDISPESAKGTTNCLDETAGGSARPACRESEVNSRSKTRTQSMVLKGGVLFRAVQQSISPRIAVFKEIVSLFFN
jgi:hypothetical protein